MIPAWGKENFVDVEQLMVDLFGKVFTGAEETLGVWAPDDWLDQSDPGPLTLFFRLPGGQVDYHKGYDECLLQASVTTGSRAESISRMSLIRAVLLPMSGFKFTMDDGYTALIRSVAEVSGPQMLTPEQQFDLRVVPATFRICVGLKDRTDYSSIIRGL